MVRVIGGALQSTCRIRARDRTTSIDDSGKGLGLFLGASGGVGFRWGDLGLDSVVPAQRIVLDQYDMSATVVHLTNQIYIMFRI